MGTNEAGGGESVGVALEWPTAVEPEAQRGICPGCKAKKLDRRVQTSGGKACLTMLIAYPAAAWGLALSGLGSGSPISAVVMFAILGIAWGQWKAERRYLACLSCAREVELR